MTKNKETWVRGQKFDDFLKEQGIYEETVLLAEFKILIELINEFVLSEKFSKVEFAKLVISQLELIVQQLKIDPNFAESNKLINKN